MNISNISMSAYWVRTFSHLFWLKRADERYLMLVWEHTRYCGLEDPFPVFIADNDT